MSVKTKRKSKNNSLKEKGSNHYVLMGDMIKSGEKYDLEELKDFRKKIDALNNNYNLVSPLTITLGDEFQGIVTSLEQGVAIIFDLEKQLIATDYPFRLRYALGYGHILTPINSEIAHGMYGEALTNTRRLLEKSVRDKRKRFGLLLPNKRFENIMINLFEVYQSFVDNWGKRDFEIVEQFYKHDDYKEVAKELNKGKDQIWKREKNLRIREFFSQQESILDLARFYDVLQNKEIELNNKFAKELTNLILKDAKKEPSKKVAQEKLLKNILIEYFDKGNIMNLVLNNLNSLLKI